jgi:hypothetical protein
MTTDSDSTIREFCRKKRLSKAKYYDMRRKGRGPREKRDGKWVRISAEAERDWDRERELAGSTTTTKTAA